MAEEIIRKDESFSLSVQSDPKGYSLRSKERISQLRQVAMSDSTKGGKLKLQKDDLVEVSSDVLWFHDPLALDITVAGGKGANLAELTQKAKAPVPPGFIITADVYQAVVEYNGFGDHIGREIKTLKAENSILLRRRAKRIQALLMTAKFPPAVERLIRRMYAMLGGGPVAVRSSGTMEDLGEASFAGQQATFLNIVGIDDVLQKIRECMASLWEERAMFYRYVQGFDQSKATIAVVVQSMVQSTVSGVMFTIEPVTSDKRFVRAEAVYGLGEAIVGGEVTPDSYAIKKSNLNVSITAEPQKRMLVKAASGTGNEWVDVPLEKVDRRKLNKSQIRELAEIGLSIEKHYGKPQDIEWGMDTDGNIYILQARPVTTVGKKSKNSTVAETAPVRTKGHPASTGVGYGKVHKILDIAKLDDFKGGVLVMDMTTPDCVSAMKRATAIVTRRGGRTCHAAIVSRELGIPCVVGVEDALDLPDGLDVTVSGGEGIIYDGRAEVRLAEAERVKSRYAKKALKYETVTKVLANMGDPSLAEAIAKAYVDGVGLARLEFILTHLGIHPSVFLENGHPEAYSLMLAAELEKFTKAFKEQDEIDAVRRKALGQKARSKRRIIFRTTDFKSNELAQLLGGSKFEEPEENPMLGRRGAWRYYHDPEFFALELRAYQILHERGYDNFDLMIPFVREDYELEEVKIEMAKFGLVRSAEGGSIEFNLFMMMEVPNNFVSLDAFIDVGIDGISIGSNDLTQLILAADRDSGAVADVFSELTAGVQQVIREVAKRARERGLMVGICGQMPTQYPEVIDRLVEWGFTSISVSPDAIDQTRILVGKAERRLQKAA